MVLLLVKPVELVLKVTMPIGVAEALGSAVEWGDCSCPITCFRSGATEVIVAAGLVVDNGDATDVAGCIFATTALTAVTPTKSFLASSFTLRRSCCLTGDSDIDDIDERSIASSLPRQSNSSKSKSSSVLSTNFPATTPPGASEWPVRPRVLVCPGFVRKFCICV